MSAYCGPSGPRPWTPQIDKEADLQASPGKARSPPEADVSPVKLPARSGRRSSASGYRARGQRRRDARLLLGAPAAHGRPRSDRGRHPWLRAGHATHGPLGTIASDSRRTRAVAARKARLLEPEEQARLAIRYGLSPWTVLPRFLDDGRIEIDSNTVERSIRPIALNRKNALVARSDGGTELGGRRSLAVVREH